MSYGGRKEKDEEMKDIIREEGSKKKDEGMKETVRVGDRKEEG